MSSVLILRFVFSHFEWHGVGDSAWLVKVLLPHLKFLLQRFFGFTLVLFGLTHWLVVLLGLLCFAMILLGLLVLLREVFQQWLQFAGMAFAMGIYGGNYWNTNIFQVQYISLTLLYPLILREGVQGKVKYEPYKSLRVPYHASGPPSAEALHI